jgi:hypothetical protein
MTGVSGGDIMDGAPFESAISGDRFQYLEEEKELETAIDQIKDVFQKTGGSSGGYGIESKSFTLQTQLSYSNTPKNIPSNWIIISKNPCYIQFCCLKLDC